MLFLVQVHVFCFQLQILPRLFNMISLCVSFPLISPLPYQDKEQIQSVRIESRKNGGAFFRIGNPFVLKSLVQVTCCYFFPLFENTTILHVKPRKRIPLAFSFSRDLTLKKFDFSPCFLSLVSLFPLFLLFSL